MNHFWNESCKGVNLFEIGFQMVEVWDIYLIKIFLKINNLGNYLKSGDVVNIDW